MEKLEGFLLTVLYSKVRQRERAFSYDGGRSFASSNVVLSFGRHDEIFRVSE